MSTGSSSSRAARVVALVAAAAVVLILNLTFCASANADPPPSNSTSDSQSAAVPDGDKEPKPRVGGQAGGVVLPGGETRWNPKYTNNKCQSYYADSDCYHYAGTFTSRQGCINKMAKILHVNPSSASGKQAIFTQALWNCDARPPTGHLDLYVYQSSPPCAVGKPYAQCPKG